MIELLINLALLIVSLLMVYLLYDAYRRSRVQQVFLLFVGMVFLSIGFLADLLGRFSGSIDIGYVLFKFYAGIATLTLFFIKAYVELSRRQDISYELLLFSSGVGALFVFRIFSEIDIEIEGGILRRSGFLYYVDGYDLATILLVILVSWVILDALRLAYMQLKRTTRKFTAKVLKIEIALFSVSSAVLIADLILLLLKMFPVQAAQIYVNSPIFLSLFAFTFATYKLPYLPYLTTQEVYGVLILNREGLIITKKIIKHELEKSAPLLGGFISAVASALEEALGTGGLRHVELSDMHIVMSWGKETIVTVFVSRPLSIHYVIANNILEELERLEIPEIIDSSFEEKVGTIITKHLAPLFP